MFIKELGNNQIVYDFTLIDGSVVSATVIDHCVSTNGDILMIVIETIEYDRLHQKTEVRHRNLQVPWHAVVHIRNKGQDKAFWIGE